MNHANLSDCTFYDTNFKGVYALDANFSGAKFHRCNFNGCHFQNANFTNSLMRNTRSENTIFSSANFSESFIEYSNFDDNKFFRTNFTMTNFYNVVFHSAILQEAVMVKTNIASTVFTDCSFYEAVMVKTNIASTVFTDCSFYDAVFAKMILNLEVKFNNCTGFPFIDGYQERLVKVAKLALKTPESLAMNTWHTCDTSHCISGWGEHLEGEFGKFVVKQYGNAFGGLLLLGTEAFNHFFDTVSEGRAYLQSVLKEHEDKKKNKTVPA